ncbi:serine beta-lactamase-like protein LACTB, mitochondrial [Hemicordylus capensis]|uniref:serine beta-lactamase-like protein LACTB, mitochondrial n=1 Tax=Hemicordylus capensis TaxID=884348 RepID=UPI0023034C60|nr:serine beta-lactamase-like protein LACTB, mitochondrial [Hemicordylus capensis]
MYSAGTCSCLAPPSSGAQGLGRSLGLTGASERSPAVAMWRKSLAVLLRRAPLPLLGSGGCRGGPSRRRLWGLGGGLGLALGLAAAAAAAVPAEEEQQQQQREGLALRRRRKDFSRAVESSRDLLLRVKDEVGTPGIVVGVSVDGKEVWSEGLGYADVENRVLCKPDTVMRIASISKSLTMVAAAKLWEEGKLDFDAPVQKYVPEFPEKEFEGKKVIITTRLLASHLSGIRHYEKDIAKVKEEKEKINRALNSGKDAPKSEQREKEDKGSEKSESAKTKHKDRNSKAGKNKIEFEHEEYCLKEKFDNVIDSLNMFKNDPLFFKPGSQYLYSTHGFTLLSAVVERASGHKFTDYMLKMFRDLDMLATGLDDNEPLIYNRSRYYIHNKKGHLVNAPYVDNSYKWAGGGFVSTVGDLVKFGNAMLYGYQLGQLENLPTSLLPGYLKPSTIAMMWTPVPQTDLPGSRSDKYGMAWRVMEKKQECGFCRQERYCATHSGRAVGASSVLLILPEEGALEAPKGSPQVPPQGVVVSIICNMQAVSLLSTALNIAMEFEKDKLAQNADKNSSSQD